MKRVLRHGSHLCLLAVVVAALWALWANGAFDLNAVKGYATDISALYGVFPTTTVLLFTLFFAVASSVLPVGILLTLLTGFLFPFWLGLGVATSAALLSAAGVFTLAQSPAGHRLRRRAAPLAHKVAVEIQRNAFWYLLFMRVTPLFPFALVNVMPAIFNISRRTFLLTTALGVLPITLICLLMGRQLHHAQNVSDLIGWQTTLSLMGLGILLLLPVAVTKVRRPQQQPNSAPASARVLPLNPQLDNSPQDTASTLPRAA